MSAVRRGPLRAANRAFSDSITYSGGQASAGQVRPRFLLFFVCFLDFLLTSLAFLIVL